VWRCIAAICEELTALLGPDGHDELAAWVGQLVEEAAPRFPTAVGTDDRPVEVAAVLLALAGNLAEQPAALRRAREVFARPEAVHPAIAAAALQVVATHAEEREQTEVLRRWRQAANPQEEQRHLSALAAVRDPELFTAMLELAFVEVRTQDAPYLLRRALHNPSQGRTAWGHLTMRWDEAVERFPASGLPRMLEGIRSFAEEDLGAEVARFLDAHPLDTGMQQVRQHVERMQAGVLAARRLRA
jgi:hypothetical protein